MKLPNPWFNRIYTQYLYNTSHAKYGNFSISEGNNRPVKSEPLSSATKPADFKLSLNWQIGLPNTRQEAGWALDFAREDFGMTQKKPSPPLTRWQHSKWCAPGHSWPAGYTETHVQPAIHHNRQVPFCRAALRCLVPQCVCTSRAAPFQVWNPAFDLHMAGDCPALCLCLSAFKGHNSSWQFSVVNVLCFLSTASTYKNFSSMV